MSMRFSARRLSAGALLLGVALILAGVLHILPASAHARFLWGAPNDGDVLSAAPSQVDAYFEEDIVKQSGTYGLAVYDAGGNQVDNQDTVLDDANRRHMTITLQSGMANGTYRVHWWTVSDQDGDAASGDYSFTVSGS